MVCELCLCKAVEKKKNEKLPTFIINQKNANWNIIFVQSFNRNLKIGSVKCGFWYGVETLGTLKHCLVNVKASSEGSLAEFIKIYANYLAPKFSFLTLAHVLKDVCTEMFFDLLF